MNICNTETVKEIYKLLQKGDSIRSVSRSTHASKNTVKRYKSIFENILDQNIVNNMPRKEEKFHCPTVGTNIDINDCLARIAQAQGYKDRGEEHFSLFKCLKCKKVEEIIKKEAKNSFLCIECNTKDTHQKWCSAADWDGKEIIPETPNSVSEEMEEVDDFLKKTFEEKPKITEDPVCEYCKEVKSHKIKWNKKRNMHQDCVAAKKRTMKWEDVPKYEGDKMSIGIDKVVEKKQLKEASEVEESDMIAVDFNTYPEIYKKLLESSKKHIRTPELQILYLINTYSDIDPNAYDL